MSITFNEVIEHELLTKNKIKYLNKKCYCGSDLVFSDDLRVMKCTNKNCIYSKLARFKLFCNMNKINISDKDLINLISKLKLISPYQMLILDTAYDNNLITKDDVANIESIIKYTKQITSKTYELYEVIRLSCIESIYEIAETLFNGYNSVEEAYNDIETNRVSFVNTRLGIKNKETTAMSVFILDRLLEYKDELIFGETLFNINKHLDRVVIVVNDNVDKFINKKDFVSYISNRYNKTVLLTSNISENTDILIKNFKSSSNKIRAAKIINNNYVAKCVNEEIMMLSDVGKPSRSSYKAIGDKILIDSEDNVINKLDKFYLKTE